jgi:hypothetical protein
MRHVTSRIPVDCSRPLTPYELIERARQARAWAIAEETRRRRERDRCELEYAAEVRRQERAEAWKGPNDTSEQ